MRALLPMFCLLAYLSNKFYMRFFEFYRIGNTCAEPPSFQNRYQSLNAPILASLLFKPVSNTTQNKFSTVPCGSTLLLQSFTSLLYVLTSCFSLKMCRTLLTSKLLQRSVMLFCLKVSQGNAMFCLLGHFCLHLAEFKTKCITAMWLRLLCLELIPYYCIS